MGIDTRMIGRGATSDQVKRLARMRALATGLLVLMAIIFVFARLWEVRFGRLGFVRAFAEAGMIGALADWFAVVALFRHPLGIPIPHTAIIRSNKSRIGQSIADFVQANFLSAEMIEQKLRAFGLTRKAAEWLTAPAVHKMITARLLQMIPKILDGLDDQDIQQFVHHNVTARLAAIKIAPVASKVLAVATTKGRGDQLFNNVINGLVPLVSRNRAMIRAKIREELPMPDFPGLSLLKDTLASGIARRAVRKLEEMLREVQRDPKHHFRRHFRMKLREVITSLRTSPAYIERGEAIKEELLDNPVIRNYFAGLAGDLKSSLLAAVEDPGSALTKQVSKAMSALSHSLREDTAVQEKIDAWLCAGISAAVQENRHEIGDIIVQTVNRWDAQTMAEKLELQMGRDLQFIRINGTLVGGIVGVLIYTFSLWLR